MEKETKVKKQKKQSDEKSKIKLWKKILIVILIILAIFLIDTFRKFMIIRTVAEQYNQDNKSTNYYTKIIGESNGAYTEIWGLGNKTLLKRTSYEKQGIEERMIYIDKDNKEQWIIVNGVNDKVAVQVEYNEENVFIVGPGTNGGLPTNNELWSQLICSVWANITTDSWAGEESYNIRFNSEYKMWVSKQSKRIIGEMNGITYTSNGDKLPSVTTHILKLNETKKEDLMLPDLTVYTIKDTKGNIVK